MISSWDMLHNLLILLQQKRAPEIAKIVGEAYYRTGKYNEALPYLKKFREEGSSFTREDIYELAYASYRSGLYSEAVKYFPAITNVDDKLSQLAYYHLADCYLKMEDKKNARLAFFSASQTDFNPEIEEVSLLNYAKLTYELAFTQFNETINAFTRFIEEFPESKYVDEAYNYLVNVYLTSKNYREALISIEQISNKTPELIKAYQRVTYFRGLELYNNLEYIKAIKIFDKSLSVQSFDNTITALAKYWQGEAYYRLKKYDLATESYNDFLLTPGSFVIDKYHLAYYNIGYCFFKKKEYRDALSWFRKYVENEEVERIPTLSDANIRIGDIYFLNREYDNAIRYYSNAIRLESLDYDYALFQRAFSYGLLKKYPEKIADLKVLMRDSVSGFIDDGLFELGKAYVAIDSLNNAIQFFEKVLVDYPNSSYLKQSILQLGLLYYNLDKNQEALALYKRVVNDYPGSQESKDALIGIKNIYVDINQVDEYFEYTKTLGEFADVRITEQDSLTYLSAENVYIEGNYEMAVNQFKTYISRYAKGSFILDAYYYLADCYLRLDETDEAIAYLEKIIDRPKNLYTEPALLITSEIYFNRADYQNALEDFALLENITETKTNLITARMGLLRTTFTLEAYPQTIEIASEIFKTDKISRANKREARYKMAFAYYETDDLDNALTHFRILAEDVTTREGAEAKYRVAEILYKTNRFIQAEEVIFSFDNTPFQYWIARSFVLLSDIYKSNDDLFQAKATLESIEQNYEQKEDGILEMVNNKLKEIKAIENERMKPAEEEVMEIDFTQSDDQYEDIFFEEVNLEPDAETEDLKDSLAEEGLNVSDTVKIKVNFENDSLPETDSLLNKSE